jgi:hypothetical protein
VATGTETEQHTPSVEDQPKDVRTRRAAVLAGVALVWAAFMASIGLLVPAAVALVAGLIGAAWIGGVRRHVRAPRPDLHRLRAGTGAAGATVAGATRTARRSSATAARSAAALSRRALAGSRARGSTALHGLTAAGRASAVRVSATASSTKEAVHDRGARIAERQRSRRRPDPRVEEALASNSQGIALAKAGKPAEAIDAFDTALALLADTGDRHHEGQVLVNLGVVHRSVGGAEAARFCWARALERLEPGTRESERTAELLGAR